MASMMGSPYDALVYGGRSPDTAKRAAEVVADHRERLSDVRTDPAVVKTMLGVGVAALVAKTFLG